MCIRNLYRYIFKYICKCLRCVRVPFYRHIIIINIMYLRTRCWNYWICFGCVRIAWHVSFCLLFFGRRLSTFHLSPRGLHTTANTINKIAHNFGENVMPGAQCMQLNEHNRNHKHWHPSNMWPQKSPKKRKENIRTRKWYHIAISHACKPNYKRLYHWNFLCLQNVKRSACGFLCTSGRHMTTLPTI